MRFKEILVPTDFSPASIAAGHIARDIAQQLDARLHVVHVVPPASDIPNPLEELARFVKTLGDKVGVETALAKGQTGRTIVEYARDKHMDLIVMGTHGRTGISHALLGSVAELVVRLAPCPVLTIPAALLDETQLGTGAAVAERTPCLLCQQMRGDEQICPDCRTRIRTEAHETWRRSHFATPVLPDQQTKRV